MIDKNKTALIVGASGMVGGYCLKALLESDYYSHVIVLVRRPLPVRIENSKATVYVVDFDHLENYQIWVKADDVFCCLGTTFLQSPRSKDFYKVDFEYPQKLADIAYRNGATGFSLISSVSANVNAVLPYSKIKGSVERAIQAIPFKRVDIFKPSFMSGRVNPRLMERIGLTALKWVDKLLRGRFLKYKPIEAQTVGKAMVIAAVNNEPGCHKYDKAQIERLLDSTKRQS